MKVSRTEMVRYIIANSDCKLSDLAGKNYNGIKEIFVSVKRNNE